MICMGVTCSVCVCVCTCAIVDVCSSIVVLHDLTDHSTYVDVVSHVSNGQRGEKKKEKKKKEKQRQMQRQRQN